MDGNWDLKSEFWILHTFQMFIWFWIWFTQVQAMLFYFSFSIFEITLFLCELVFAGVKNVLSSKLRETGS